MTARQGCDAIKCRSLRRPVFRLLLVCQVALAGLVSAAPAQAQGTPIPDLIGTEWLLEDLGGSGVIDYARATLAFPALGKAEGHGSCNRFFGPVVLNGERISFGNMASTHKQCVEAVSDQEQRYLTALQAADRISFDGTFLFVYSKSVDKPLRFTKL